MFRQFHHIVILIISQLLSSNCMSNYRNNNNVIVLKSKVERRKGTLHWSVTNITLNMIDILKIEKIDPLARKILS